MWAVSWRQGSGDPRQDISFEGSEEAGSEPRVLLLLTGARAAVDPKSLVCCCYSGQMFIFEVFHDHYYFRHVLIGADMVRV